MTDTGDILPAQPAVGREVLAGAVGQVITGAADIDSVPPVQPAELTDVQRASQLEASLRAEGTPWAFLRANEGHLFRVFLGTSADVRELNDINSRINPLPTTQPKS